MICPASETNRFETSPSRSSAPRCRDGVGRYCPKSGLLCSLRVLSILTHTGHVQTTHSVACGEPWLAAACHWSSEAQRLLLKNGDSLLIARPTPSPSYRSICVAPLMMNSSFGPGALACSSWLCHSEPASLPATTSSG